MWTNWTRCWFRLAVWWSRVDSRFWSWTALLTCTESTSRAEASCHSGKIISESFSALSKKLPPNFKYPLSSPIRSCPIPQTLSPSWEIWKNPSVAILWPTQPPLVYTSKSQKLTPEFAKYTILPHYQSQSPYLPSPI